MASLTGFGVIGIVIGVGWLLAKAGVLALEQRRLMSNLAFTVASPALLCSLMATADLGRVFARSALASYGAIVLTAVAAAVVARCLFHRRLAEGTLSTLLAAYSNAGNLGLPVAAYALGDITWIVPILVLQVAVLQPVALALLDAATAAERGRPASGWRLASLPFRNPLTVGVLVGLALNVADVTLPPVLGQPLSMVGDAAVPLMLIAFGVSLCLDPKPAGGAEAVESWVVIALKVLIQPSAAFALASFLGLGTEARHAVTVIACLPPAQNIFVFASRYGVRLTFARDTIFRATAVSAAVLLLVATVLV
ncbi:MAG: AEC family transporter [Propionibacteriaceae bacterium]|nr:AEC family transporter [Propionibacteriaceae bacterium]